MSVRKLFVVTDICSWVDEWFTIESCKPGIVFDEKSEKPPKLNLVFSVPEEVKAYVCTDRPENTSKAVLILITPVKGL